MNQSNARNLMIAPFQRFFQRETSGSIILFIAAIAAIAMANSPWQALYTHFWQLQARVGIEGLSISLPLHTWINDGLMAVFFLLVGLEIKRELLVGELSHPRKAALPIIAAIGGMLIPGLLYIILNPPSSLFSKGWGIPTVTDIAFSLGVLALLGNRVPLFLKVFLTALAIADDVGAVLIVTFFYSTGLQWMYVGIAALIWGSLFLLNHLQVRWLPAYILLGLILWLAMLYSGVHTSIAGVLLAFSIPTGTVIKEHSQDLNICKEAPLLCLERILHPWVTYGIMPLFAFANAGVLLSTSSLAQSLIHPITQGITAGLLIGKPIGIFTFSWLSIKFKLAELPSEIRWSHLYGLACLGGIGFTVSLFIAGLAFQQAELDNAKIGILTASLLSGLFGASILWKTLPPLNRKHSSKSVIEPNNNG